MQQREQHSRLPASNGLDIGIALEIKRYRGKMGAARCFFNCLALIVILLAPVGAMAKTGGKTIRIVVLGDSLTAGYGLRPSEAFPVKLQQALQQRGQNVLIINAGVSGDTTAAGLARLDWAVAKTTDAVIVELGANDILRGLPPARAASNLDKILRQLRRRGVELMVAGMLAPPSMGKSYAQSFNGIFAPLVKKYDAVYYPFFLKDVVMRPKLNQSDGMHPNPQGVAIIVKNIMPKVEALIKRVNRRRLAHSGG